MGDCTLHGSHRYVLESERAFLLTMTLAQQAEAGLSPGRLSPGSCNVCPLRIWDRGLLGLIPMGREKFLREQGHRLGEETLSKIVEHHVK